MKRLIVILVIFLNSCALFQSEMESVNDFLPRDTDVPGWMRSSFPEEFSGFSVSNYKKEYKTLGVERLSICHYNSLDNENYKVAVEIIKFNSVLNAYGFFSKKANEVYFEPVTKIDIYRDDFALSLRGDIVVYAYPYSDFASGEILKKLIDVATTYIGQYYDHQSLPAKISILDNPYKAALIYSITTYEPAGIDDVFVKTWQHRDIKVSVFFSERKSTEECWLMFNRFIKNGWTLSETEQGTIAFIKPKSKGYSFIAVHERWIYGCIDTPSIQYGGEILEILKTRISLYEKK